MKQMRQDRILLPSRVRYVHPPRTSGVDHQVELFRSFSGFELIPENAAQRIYAVTMKNVPIVVGFAIITAGQLAVGICLVTYAARRNSKTKPWTRKNYVSFRAPACFIAIASV